MPSTHLVFSSLSYRRAEIEGFFNLLFSHLLTLFPLDAPEIRAHLDTLLKTIISVPDHTSTKYRMCVVYMPGDVPKLIFTNL